MRLRELLRRCERGEGTREPGGDLLERDVTYCWLPPPAAACWHRTLAKDNDEKMQALDALGLDERTARIARD